MNKRILLLAALALAAVACGDDDGDGSSDDNTIRADGSINNPIDASAGIDATASQPDSATADSGSNPVKGAPGCFAGTPTTSVQFLNACAEGYVLFHNLQRLPGYTGGLPTIN
jgi:hypothetical protein